MGATMPLKQRFLNYCYFSICNSILLMLFCTIYLFPKTWLANSESYNLLEYLLAIIYTFSSHFSLISLCFIIINTTTLISILIKNNLRLIIQATFVAILICVLIVDAYVFHVDGVHLTDFFSITISPLFINDLSPLISTSRIRGVIIVWVIFFIIEYKIACKIECSNWLQNNYFIKRFTIVFIITFLVSQPIYFYIGRNHKIFYFAQYLPFQFRNNFFLQDSYPNIKKITQVKSLSANYPLAPLVTTEVMVKKNIIIIAADAWRADSFNAVDSPNLWKFAKSGTIFNNHLSAANATRHSLFCLFYSLPASHWHTFLINKQSPVFIDRLQQLNYQLGIFISTQVARDQLDKSIFSKINNLRLNSSGNTPSELDKNTTNDWIKWYENRDKLKPFFSFIFYYSVHEHDFPSYYTNKYLPTKGKIKYADLSKIHGKSGIKESYKISVNYIDSLAGKIINTLKNHDDLENTIVIITSDHGHQLNDNGQYIWGHGSNFTEYQLKVPLAIIGDKFNTNSTINSLTTHYDLIATLMPNFLGIKNNTADYSIGRNLLINTQQQQWSVASTCLETMANSMLSFGIIDKNQCIKIFPSGKYQIIDKKNIINHEKIKTDYNHISDLIQYLTRFLQ